MGSPEEVFVQSILDGKAERARSMLEKNPDLAKARVWHGITPLHAAAEADRPGLVATLLDAGADPLARTDWGHDPATWAVVCGSESVASALIEHGVPLTPLVAAGLGRTDAVGEDAPADALWIAARNGRLETARHLRAGGADPEAPGWLGGPAVHWAAHAGHAEVVAWLLDEGADPKRTDNELEKDAAGWATEGRREGTSGDFARIYRLLGKAGAAVSIFDWVDLGETSEIRRMLEEKPGLIDARRDTATPLHAAVEAGRIEVVRTLLDHGPELSLEDGEGRTPIMIAMLSDRQEIAALLRSRLYFD